MAKSDYSKDLFKQVQELMLKCDNLSSEVKTIEKRTEKKFKKQLKEQKEYFTQKIEVLEKENKQGLEKGLKNLFTHIDNLKNRFGLKVIVALNRYQTDTEDEIEFLQEKLKEKEVELSLVEGWAKGGNGAIDIANKIVKITSQTEFVSEFSMVNK